MSVWVFKVVPISISDLPISLCLVWVFKTATISIGHHFFSSVWVFWDLTNIDRSSSCQFVFEFLGPHLYRSVIIWLVLVWVLGPHLYRSVIILSILVLVFRDRTYINWSSSCQFKFEFFGTTPISINHCLISWVESCSASICAYLVESFGLKLHLILHSSLFFSVCRSFLVSVIFVLFIVSWSNAIHCVYTPHIGYIFF